MWLKTIEHIYAIKEIYAIKDVYAQTPTKWLIAS